MSSATKLLLMEPRRAILLTVYLFKISTTIFFKGGKPLFYYFTHIHAPMAYVDG